MEKFLQGAEGQLIDPHGKTRMLHFSSRGEKISVMISPLPPLDLPIDENVYPASFANVERFVSKKELEITGQQPTQGGRGPTQGGRGPTQGGGAAEDVNKIRGLWLQLPPSFERAPIDYIYIPLKISNPLPDVPTSEENPPLKSRRVPSQVETFREAGRVASLLKKYVVYTYSRFVRSGGSGDPENFIKTQTTVRPGTTYDFSSSPDTGKALVFENNRVMYSSSGKLILPSEEIRAHLLSYLKTELINNLPGVLDLADQRRIPEYYQTVSDFRSAPNQLVFDTKQSLLVWLATTRRRNRGAISEIFLPNEIEPYYYRSPAIEGGKIALVQNVLPDSDASDGVKGEALRRAETVAYEWLYGSPTVGEGDPLVRHSERGQSAGGRNPGYRPRINPKSEGLGYTLYDSVTGTTKTRGKGEPVASLVKYGEGAYGAILFFG